MTHNRQASSIENNQRKNILLMSCLFICKHRSFFVAIVDD